MTNNDALCYTVSMAMNNGYFLVPCPECPNSWVNGYIYHHRKVIQDHLGRLLKRTEHVHHINGDRMDNRIENLQLLTNEQHARITQASPKLHVKECVQCGKEYSTVLPNRSKYCNRYCGTKHREQQFKMKKANQSVTSDDLGNQNQAIQAQVS